MKKCLSNFYYMKKGFSLMEMMIVLLVISIIAAAAAPMIAKKSARSAAGANGAIGYFGIGNNFGNQDNDASIIFGTNGLPANANNAKLYISSKGDNNPHIALGRGNSVLGILGINSNNGITLGNRNANTGVRAVTLGNEANASGQNAIAIGSATATETDSIAIGNAAASQTNSIAIGNGATSILQANTIALGTNASARNTNAIAIGSATARGANSVAIGNGANARNSDAIVIGNSARSVDNNGILISNNNDNPSTIRIGKAGDTIFLGGQRFDISADGVLNLGGENSIINIPGNLVVGHNTILGDQEDGVVWLRGNVKGKGNEGLIRVEHKAGGEQSLRGIYENDMNFANLKALIGKSSDRRLKNVGKPFTGGLEELKKLDLYNFTYKYDNNKTPQVGVMAQDLQKVFPNAVWEGTDKYLKIRWDEMFYAVINAVKELDNKISTAFEQIKANTDKVTKLQAQVDEQQKVISDLEERLAKLEKKEK